VLRHLELTRRRLATEALREGGVVQRRVAGRVQSRSEGGVVCGVVGLVEVGGEPLGAAWHSVAIGCQSDDYWTAIG